MLRAIGKSQRGCGLLAGEVNLTLAQVTAPIAHPQRLPPRYHAPWTIICHVGEILRFYFTSQRHG